MAASLDEIGKEYIQKRGKVTATLMNPFTSKEKKRQAFREFIGNLSKEAFEQFGPMELAKMDIGKKTCQEYSNIEAQIKGFLEWLPRYKASEDMVREVIRQKRQDYKLPL